MLRRNKGLGKKLALILTLIMTLSISIPITAWATDGMGNDAIVKVTADKKALTQELIAGENENLDNVTSDLNLTVTGAVYGSEIQWDTSQHIAIEKDGRIIPQEEDITGKIIATITYEGVSDTEEFIVKILAKDSKKTDEVKVMETIEELRRYYQQQQEFTFRNAMAYIYTSNHLEKDISILHKKFKVDENPTGASQYAGNIMGLIASRQNPRNYKGIDYVTPLVNSQNQEGKFIIGQWDDYPTTIAFSMIALDMAEESYNKEKAVEGLLAYQDSNDGGFGGVDETAMSIMALGFHRDISGVEMDIERGLQYLKINQKGSGGFESWGEENPYSISAVIQSLIALGEDPLSEDWIKDGNTMLDALLSFKVDDHFENPSEWGTEIDMATEQAFTALADLYRGKSMFHELKLQDQDPVKIEIKKPSRTKIAVEEKLSLESKIYDEKGQQLVGYDLIWISSAEDIAVVNEEGLVTAKKEGTVIITVKLKDNEEIKDSIELTIEPKVIVIEREGNEIIKNGEEARVEMKIENMGKEARKTLLIVALYDKTADKMMNYSYVNQVIKPDEVTNMGAGFVVPKEGDYIIKAFVWDNFQDRNILLPQPVEIEVKH